MLTIGELASYAGVTARAVRHYHRIGLLPEPQRNGSGYRSYDAAAVVRLVRIRTLAEAGVPLSRVRDLLDADAQTFALATDEIDLRLGEQIRALQDHRRRIAQLGSGDTLAVPQRVLDYLDALRAIGAPEQMIESERDAWILVAARWPDAIPGLMAEKTAQLADPKTIRLYQLIARVAETPEDEDAVTHIADLMSEMFEEAARSGVLSQQNDLMPADAAFERLMDSFAANAHPAMARLMELMAQRGWSGWTRVERRGS